MSLENIVLWIIFGALAGFLAGKIMKSSNGLIANVILGVVGSFVGGWLAGQLGIATGTGFSLMSLLIAIGGACVVIFIARLFAR